MERESNPLQAPCRRGCGFYGSPNTDNLCSVCHKEALKKKNQQPPNSTTSNSTSVSSSGLSALSSPSTALVSVPSSVMDTAIPTIPIISSVVDSKLAENLSENDTACGSASSSVSGADDDKDGDRDSKKKKNRCVTCRKKVGLTGFECRCGGMYCAVHRYSDKHECPFDYRLLGATEIRRNNPVVVGEKIKKI